MAGGLRAADAGSPACARPTTAWCSATCRRRWAARPLRRGRPRGGGEGVQDRALPRPPRVPRAPRPGRPLVPTRPARARPPSSRRRSRPRRSAPTSPSTAWPRAYAACGEPSRFVALCETIIRQDPRDWRARLALARHLRARGPARGGARPAAARGGGEPAGAARAPRGLAHAARRWASRARPVDALPADRGGRGLLPRSRTSARRAATARTTCSGAARTATSGTRSWRSAWARRRRAARARSEASAATPSATLAAGHEARPACEPDGAPPVERPRLERPRATAGSPGRARPRTLPLQRRRRAPPHAAGPRRPARQVGVASARSARATAASRASARAGAGDGRGVRCVSRASDAARRGQEVGVGARAGQRPQHDGRGERLRARTAVPLGGAVPGPLGGGGSSSARPRAPSRGRPRRRSPRGRARASGRAGRGAARAPAAARPPHGTATRRGGAARPARAARAASASAARRCRRRCPRCRPRSARSAASPRPASARPSRARAAASSRPSRAMQPAELLLGRAVHDHQAVEAQVHAGLHEERGVRDHAPRPRRPPAPPRAAAPPRARAGGRCAFRRSPRRRVGEDHAPQRLAVDRCRPAPRIAGAERAPPRRRGRRRPGAIDLVRDAVEVEGGEARRRRAARRTCDFPHAMPPVRPTRSTRTQTRAPARRRASTVFFMSSAMVSGPTPPGTGVSAPATSRTDGACTSPTRA